MAKTKDGRKYERVPAHTRTLPNGKVVRVKPHVRSNPNFRKRK